MVNFWKNEHLRSLVRQNLADLVAIEYFWFFSIFEISWEKSIFEEKSKIEKKSKIFYRNHIGEILSYDAPKVLIFSEICHTLRLE